MTLKAPDFDDDDVQQPSLDDRLDSIAMAMEEIIKEQHEVIMNGDPNEVQPLHQYGVSPLLPNTGDEVPWNMDEVNANVARDRAEFAEKQEFDKEIKQIVDSWDKDKINATADLQPLATKPTEEDSIIKKAKFFAVMDYYVRAWAKQGEELKKLADEYEQELLADERYDVDIAKITIKVTPQDIVEMKIFLDGYLTDNRLMPKDQIPANISMSRTQAWVGNILVAQQVEAFDTIRRLAEIEAIKAEAGEEITDLDRLTGEDARAWKEQIREYIFPASMKSRIKETVATIKNNPAPFVNEYLDEVASLGLLTDQIEQKYNSLISDPEMISEAQMRNLLPAHLKPYLTVLLKPTITARKG